MYTDIFPKLRQKYNFDNFEEIIGALETHFHGVFNLAVLEEEIKHKRQGSYTEFFDKIISQLNSPKLFTIGEVSQKISEILQTDESVRDCFLKRIIFVPELEGKPSAQLAFLEKTATGQLKPAEPVTYMDMLRLAEHLKSLAKKQYNTLQFGVFNLLNISEQKSGQIKSQNDALIVNFNRDPKGLAKWGIVDLRDKYNPQIYCETPLLEVEKKELEKRLSIEFNEVSARKAVNLISTGYSAIAWLDQNIAKAWNFDVSSDFNSLLSCYVFAQFRGDSSGIKYRFKEDEYKRFCTPEFRKANAASYAKSDYENRWNGFAPIKYTAISALPEVAGEKITLNSIVDVIRIAGGKDFGQKQFDAHWNPAYRSNIPGFIRTMTQFGKPPALKIEEGLAVLDVPKEIDERKLKAAHIRACSETDTNSYFFKNLSLSPSEDFIPQRDIATAMVINTFRGQSKQPRLKINLPRLFDLNQAESHLISKQVEDNAYLTELDINEDNVSLRLLKEELLPVLGRNRWLKESGYLPPMIDNYWQRVARYWLLHLNAVDDLSGNKNEHKIFKQCVEDMGSKGLLEVLSFLKDADLSENLLSIYGRNRPLFYLACQQHEVKEYLHLLTEHLANGYAFPFNQLSAAYQPGHDKSYLKLLGFINEKDSFEQIHLTECLRHKQAFAGFLRELAKEAQRGGWTGLIVIPELECEKTATEEFRELRALYRQVNNVILNNRHHKQGAELSQKIKEVSEFDQAKHEHLPLEPKAPQENEPIALRFEAADQGPWPLQRGGGVQLQMQQQQEIQQNRQMQQEQQRMGVQVMEEVITSELVTYKNIDKLLGKYFENYIAENPCDVQRFAKLGIDGESPLEAFFHTWISAEPTVKARHAISAMTQDAAKMLLRYHSRVSSGLSLTNLPKGFYTQRSKDGQLILCYNTEVGYTCGPTTPLTLNLQVTKPAQEFWEGDFRQFNIDFYLDNHPPLKTAQDFQTLVLFEALQPPKNYKDDWNKFKRENPGIAAMIKDERRVLQHWQVFIQAWQYDGVKGIEAFLALKDHELLLQLPQACDILFSRQPDLAEWTKAWAQRGKANEQTLRAIGQVYYRYGDETFSLLIAKFRQIENKLGTQFFDAFHAEVLSKADDYNFYITPAFFNAIDSMIKHLSSAKSQPQREAWLHFCSKHLNHVPAEQTEVLWKAFDHFVKELLDMGLSLSGDEFAQLEPQNMLVAVDRILNSLRSLPALEEKTRFLKSLHKLDLSHGGVHYAIQQEHFKYFDDDLELHHFKHGKPTYGPELPEIYTWTSTEAALNIRRTLASRAQFSHDDFTLLSDKLANSQLMSRHQLLWLLYTQYDVRQMPAIIDKVQKLPLPLIASIASHLHQAVFRFGHEQLSISLQTLESAQDLLQSARGQQLLFSYPHGNFLEALDILFEGDQQPRMEDFLKLFEAKTVFKPDYPQFLQLSAHKAATLFGALTENQFKDFIKTTEGLTLAVVNELELLLKHLLSINFSQGNPQALYQAKNWDDFLKTIAEMNNKPVNRTAIRKAFINQLADQGIVFKYSRSGEFRNLTEEDRPEGLGLFIDHQHRLWTFLKNHIVVPTEGNSSDALRPLMAFFTRLQLNRTYLNEVEPLLAILEKTAKDQVWSASYFSQILDVLKPEDEQVAFPLDMLQVILKDELLKAKPLDNAEKEFPQGLIHPLKGILKNSVFSREQQTALCQLALKEFQFTRSTALLNETINLLSTENHAPSRDSALQILNSSPNTVALENRFAKLRQLLNHASSNDLVRGIWEKTTALWLRAMAADSREEGLFNQIMAKFGDDQSDQRALMFHIIAWSSLQPGLREKESYEYELDRKAPKLIERLSKLSLEELGALAATYPKQPSPGADDLIRLLRRADAGSDFKTELSSFLKNPHPEVRPDYSHVAKTRAADLRRMFNETRVTDGNVNRPLTATEIARISLMFAELKQLETGESFVEGCKKPISELSQDELAEAFHRLCKSPASDSRQTQIWALEFHALGLTTRKYPHMAQQFALFANDVAITAPSRVLRLSTGEGKSHFVAMRAAKKAAQGQTATVFTAKRSLAVRDLEDYQAFYDYLKLKASSLSPKSSRESYTDFPIHYTTLGDLSLFLDEQSYQGKPIEIDPDRTEGLGDELDYTYFEEGRKTEFNYARPTGRTPKQMMWFYQAMNAFYNLYKEDLQKEGITQESVNALLLFLTEKANDDEDRINFLSQLARDGLQLVSWIQSAHDAAAMERGSNYSVVEENVQIGEASYLLKEIIPLTSSNQKSKGSTFSAGVHQLLAVRLNEEAKKKNEAQNYHVHAESHIISSQVAAKLLRNLWTRWEGYTGSVSSSQAQALNKEQNTQVLQVSTNQRDLRYWHKAKFYQNADQRIEAMLQQLRHCMENKQSILFACKNDKKVLEIQAILRARLTQEELANIIFYTNEDEETSSEILQRKQEMEKWKGGKKQNGITLVASGFGRGDNVGGEAVFIFDTGDVNDLLQTGGRTARNGEEGQVFQFYIENELKQERDKLWNIITRTRGLDQDNIRKNLDAVAGETENAKVFEQVMLLREYVFTLQNSANQGFRAGLAQFSGWGMSLISTFLDPGQASEFTSMLTRHLSGLEKKWLSISANEDITPTEKVREIEAKIKLTADDLEANYHELMGTDANIPKFNLNEMRDIELLIKLEEYQPSSKTTRNMATLGAIISALSLNIKDQDVLANIPEQLQILATDAEVLQNFVNDAARFQTIEQLSEQLSIRVLQITKASELHGQIKTGGTVIPKAEEVLKGVSSHNRQSFVRLSGKLLPSLQQLLGEWLIEPGMIDEKDRVEKVLPLLDYLSGFSQSEQLRWAALYFENLDNLLLDTPKASMSRRFSGQAMSYGDNESLWHLAHAFPNHEGELFDLLKKSVQSNYTHRIRMLRRCEDLMTRLPEQDKELFLRQFAAAMTQFSEGVNWDTFNILVKKTERWWNLNDGQYRPELQAMWRSLAQDLTEAQLPAITSALSQPGKAWYQGVQLAVTSPEVIGDLKAAQWKTLYQLWVSDYHFTAEQQKQSATLMHPLLESLKPDEDQAPALTGQVLQNYEQFLRTAKQEGHTELGNASAWYLSSIQTMPAIVKELNQFVNKPPFSLQNLQAVLEQYPFNETASQVLLHKANALNMNLADFTLCCQSLTSANWSKQGESKGQLEQGLQTYLQFLHAARHQQHSSLNNGSDWYLEMLKKRPEASQELMNFVHTPSFSLQTLQKILEQYSFSNIGLKHLLTLVNQQKMQANDFAMYCQALSSVNWSRNEETEETLSQILQVYSKFFASARIEKHTQIEEGSHWFLSMQYLVPEARAEFQGFAAAPAFKLETLQQKLTQYAFGKTGTRLLLQLVNSKHMSAEDFSIHCEILKAQNWSTQEEPVEDLATVLEACTQFIETAKAQSHTDIVKSGVWYLDLLKKRPVASRELKLAVSHARINLQDLQKYLEQYAFSDAGIRLLISEFNQLCISVNDFPLYCQALASINWSLQDESDTQLQLTMEACTQFLQVAQEQNHSNLGNGLCWYLSLRNRMPSLHKELEERVEDNRFSLEDWQSAMDNQSLTEVDIWTLLRVAKKLKQDFKEFSVSCQSLGVVRKIVAESDYLSLSDKKQFDDDLSSSFAHASALPVLFKVWIDFQDNIKANPASLLQSLQYLRLKNISPEKLELLSRALFMAVGSEPKSSPEELSYIMQGVNRFQNETPEKLKKLNRILQGSDKLPQEQYLYDNFVSYLANTAGSEQEAVKDMAEWFYEKASDCHGDVEVMKENANRQSWYLFDNTTANQARNRVMWMHLLNHGAFVNSDKEETRRINWSNTKNQALLEHGLRHYTIESKRLLAQKPKSSLGLVRDLSTEQQQGLLKLAKELSIIGKPQLDLKALHGQKESQKLLSSLENSLGQLSKQYRGAWFKSNSRKEQIDRLQSQLQEQGMAPNQNRYIEFLNVLRQVRQDILAEDITENQTRNGRKMNSSGHSRLLSTVNQMEDQVVRHWVQDTSVLQDFQVYQTRCKEDIVALTAKLTEAAQDYMDDIWARNGMMDRLFWKKANADERARLVSLHCKLSDFMKAYEGKPQTMRSEDLTDLIKALENDQRKLPGHMQTLVTEILSRAKSLGTHLIQNQEEPHPASPLDRGMAGG
ncbi:hypothetical protein [Legionella birminghamensis]|uniref:hypothetical protein n=1 Tax=Legionella birminghamensis TaxID=28083 RepID=UPI0010415575|nr:hypothetical protein [Legionella birminghamensis]